LKSNKAYLIPFVFVLAAFLCINGIDCAETKGKKLSSKRYADPKGYFKIVPPAGWRVQGYPKDPRGKVAFIGPEANVDLRILVNAVDFSTTDELVTFCKGIEARTGLSTNIQRTKFGGRPAVKRSFEVKGRKLYVIDFLVGSIDHNIQFCAPANIYQKYLSLVTKSIETYEARAQAASEKVVAQHAVAKKLRLAQLMMEDGNYDLALVYIKEGLEISPKDTRLVKLKKQIESKRRKP